MRSILLFTMILCVTFSLTNATAMKDYAAIEAQRQASNTAMADRDVGKFVSFFDTDYIITNGGSAKMLSLDAEIKALKVMFNDYANVKYVRTPKDINISNVRPLAVENST